MTTLYKKEDQSSPEQPELTLIGAAFDWVVLFNGARTVFLHGPYPL
jgi:hypothetical protein